MATATSRRATEADLLNVPAIREDLSQASASAFNAAVNYLRDKDVVQATTFAERAAQDPERRAKVDELRKLIADRKK